MLQRHLLLSWSAITCVVLASGAAGAQPSPADRVLATELFKQGRTLMAEKKYEEACPKLAESHRLDPGGGTLLNLAFCHEEQGKTATAWSELNEALSFAQRDGRRDRERLAKERVAALEPKLSRLAIAVPPDVVVPELVVRRDGTPVTQIAWGTAVPIDPGEHRVDAEAPGRVAWTTTIVIGPNADHQTVTIPVLAVSEPPAVEPPPAVPVVAPAPPPAPSVPMTPPKSERPFESPPSLVPGLVVGGAGVVALGIGVGFGIRALALQGDSDADCDPAKGGCSDEGAQKSIDAGTAADVSTVAFSVSVVGMGVGGFLLWRALRTQNTAAIGLRVGVTGGSVAARW